MPDDAPFEGFPAEGLAFLSDLVTYNEREWFIAHKAVYQRALVEPGQRFVAALGQRLQTLSPDLQYDTRTNGSGSMLRIYRDVRFSKDKSPYNTHMRFFFWEGAAKKMQNPGFYIWFDGQGGAVYAGMWRLDKALLAAFREAIADDRRGPELQALIASVQAAGPYTIGGSHYKRVPRGYPNDHPRAELLRYNGLHAAAPDLTTDQLTSPELVDVCLAHCQGMAPIVRWLVALQTTTLAER